MEQHWDLIVAGGGFAGTAAAIAAARGGAKVLLMEKGNALGGAAYHALVHPFMPNRIIRDGVRTELSQGIFTEIRNGAQMTQGENMKLQMNRLVLASGAELLFHAEIIDVHQTGRRVDGVTVFCQGKKYEFEADYFIDATGDANLIAMTDFPFRLGREPQDQLCQPMTLCFRVGGVDSDEFFREKPLLQAIYKEGQSSGRIKNPRENVLVCRTECNSVVHFNTTRIIKRDPTDIFDLTRAEIDAREQVHELFELFKEKLPSFRNASLLVTADEIGIRESRMIDGEYLLTGEEAMTCPHFPDGIACANYDIDIHNPEGTGTYIYSFKDDEFYTIPYRCLIPKGAENLLAAGRCISVDHAAQASMRIMPIVCTIGEAAGTAMALAIRDKTDVHDVDAAELRAVLAANGAFLG